MPATNPQAGNLHVRFSTKTKWLIAKKISMKTPKQTDWLDNLDAKVDNGIIKLLPRPIKPAYSAYNNWCKRHALIISATIFAMAVAAACLVIINNHYYPRL